MAGRTLLILLAAAGLLGVPRPAQAQKLLRDYQFKETLKDSTNLGPEIQAINGGLGNGVYTFLADQGLKLEKSGVTDHYTIELTMKFEDVESWQKVVDFKNRSSDNGLYVYNGQLQFYDFGIGGDFQANQEYRVKLERDRNTNMVRGYINDALTFEFADADGHAIIDNETLSFFLDDDGTGEEEAPGAVTRIRIWDAPNGK
jgi:OmpA-OmpF porin, OOP family